GPPPQPALAPLRAAPAGRGPLPNRRGLPLPCGPGAAVAPGRRRLLDRPPPPQRPLALGEPAPPRPPGRRGAALGRGAAQPAHLVRRPGGEAGRQWGRFGGDPAAGAGGGPVRPLGGDLAGWA